MKRAVATYLLLFAVWLAWSGHFTVLLLTFGALSCLGVLLLSKGMGIVDRESHPYQLGLRPLLYLPWLFWEVVKANVDVAKRILHPAMPISPRLIRIRPSQRSVVGVVGFANSITLTPGTVTLDVQRGRVLVHALTEEAARDLTGGEMDRRATWLEGDG